MLHLGTLFTSVFYLKKVLLNESLFKKGTEDRNNNKKYNQI